ncbi:hypothetical protein NCAST_23_00180 [Nocardia asteroides NBRC 15531]|uniref:Transposase n=1 Tax=Nocardia asteroides NBRC 15531 TaxID=1110697 RepID=U5EA88_NOCAS|nr:hypothetical protein NCAST_23_00180 [Nocardia asteroides NBRC 15531]SFL97031.1 hypothetical protein SAMN05444423_1011574 [Nocardia asteroides]VEG37668.1 Uncharacterised protein [Nocardia asteroides]
MNPIARLENLGDQHASAVKRIRDQFEQIDQRAKQSSRELAARERERRADRDKQRAPRKSAAGPLAPSELLGHPELLLWALRK